MKRTHLLPLFLTAALTGCAVVDDASTNTAQPADQAAMLDDDTFVEGPFAPVFHVPSVLDSDGDGLPNVIEQATCTSPNDADTDDDGISDGVERAVVGGFDFPAHGADPCHRDIFVQEDYEERVNPAGVLESARMGATLVSALESFYDGLAIANPDGTTGIRLHVLPGNVLPAGVNCANPGVQWLFPQDHFHRATLCLNVAGSYYGFGAIVGQRFRIVAPPVNANPADDLHEQRQYNWYWLFLHELGHNLGLRHGGGVDTNRIPHYASLMNYLYDESFDGSPKTLAGAGIRYSDGRFAPFVLDETTLLERASFPGLAVADLHFLTNSPQPHAVAACAGGPCVDWSRDGISSAAPVAVDLTTDGVMQPALRDSSDLARIAANMGLGLPGHP